MPGHKNPALTVDGIIIIDGKLVLIKRGREPFKGQYALPGGFVEYGETVEDAVVREVLEETGLETRIKILAGVYSDPARDPRGHTVSVAYLLEKTGGQMRSGDDASGVELFELDKLPKLAFDHGVIVQDFIKASL